MICRLWRGWTTRENADAYERIVRGEVIPGIEAREISGFRHIDLMKTDLGDEFEFVTLMWFEASTQSRRSWVRIIALVTCPRRRAPCSSASTNALPITKSSTGGSSSG